MRKLILPLALIAALGLAGCGQKAKNEAAEANGSIGGDSNTMAAAVDDINAAQAAAFNNAEQAYAGNDSHGGDEGSGDGNEIFD
ncbi:hypothetical protein [Sphingomonas sp.]|uniref:hypothetical protein n=1 Tax=Sphingomonas sp. TaxID=28214 RepID=UPI001AFFCFFD|nr:hypothetical protein [Sphingomonas sp.]MBO9713156.1 hypothetical protein [Sphingomonas sp.]